MKSSTNYIYNYLSEQGLSTSTAKYLNLLIIILLVLIFVFLLDIILKKILKLFSARVAKKTKTNFDDILITNKVPSNFAHIIPAILFFQLVPYIFSDFKYAEILVSKTVQIIIIVLVIQMIRCVLSSTKDYLKESPKYRDKPIDSYIQIVMIIAWITGFVLTFAIIANKSIWDFITALGAASAIIILVFKDTILGFVASIQVSINDMIRIGDWITFEKFGADGDVIEINLVTVKVQNFDKTITTIPTYALISDSFKNWRGMLNSDGRRIKRAINIKMDTIKHLSENEITTLSKIVLLESYLKNSHQELCNFNNSIGSDNKILINGRNLTNIGVFRKYAELFVENHPAINKNMTIMVRQLKPTIHGLPIEVYAFSNDQTWKNYEFIIADIFDHLLASIHYFDLEVFELPTKFNV